MFVVSTGCREGAASCSIHPQRQPRLPTHRHTPADVWIGTGRLHHEMDLRASSTDWLHQPSALSDRTHGYEHSSWRHHHEDVWGGTSSVLVHRSVVQDFRQQRTTVILLLRALSVDGAALFDSRLFATSSVIRTRSVWWRKRICADDGRRCAVGSRCNSVYSTAVLD